MLRGKNSLRPAGEQSRDWISRQGKLHVFHRSFTEIRGTFLGHCCLRDVSV